MNPIPNHLIFNPRYWPVWAGYWLIYLITLLPHKVRLGVGAMVGHLGYYLAPARRRIVRMNLGLCFPALTDEEQRRLTRATFRATGMGLIETAIAWLRPVSSFAHLARIEGLEHLRQAHSEGKGVMLLGMHLSTLDFCGAVLSTHQGFDVMYRRNKNPLLEAIMTRGRKRLYPFAIERDDVRTVIRRLKSGAVVWYGPDQDYGPRHSVFAPFFGVPAATIVATARIASIAGSPVIFFEHFRCSDGTYRIRLTPFADFPTGDEQVDAARVNARIEAAVRQAPEQYWWLHRRFKTQPPGVPRPYDGKIKRAADATTEPD